MADNFKFGHKKFNGERSVGEIFVIDNEAYVCIECEDCQYNGIDCSFNLLSDNCISHICSAVQRKDKKNVLFLKYEQYEINT